MSRCMVRDSITISRTSCGKPMLIAKVAGICSTCRYMQCDRYHRDMCVCIPHHHSLQDVARRRGKPSSQSCRIPSAHQPSLPGRSCQPFLVLRTCRSRSYQPGAGGIETQRRRPKSPRPYPSAPDHPAVGYGTCWRRLPCEQRRWYHGISFLLGLRPHQS